MPPRKGFRSRRIANYPQTFQPSYQSFCHLTQYDDSCDFSFIINFEQDQEQNHIEIKTTLNKARVISQKVNTFYQTDQTIQYIVINVPSQFNYTKDQTQNKEKIETIFQSLIDSTNKPIIATEEDILILTLLMRSIEYDEKKSPTLLTFQNISVQSLMRFHCYQHRSTQKPFNTYQTI